MTADRLQTVLGAIVRHERAAQNVRQLTTAIGKCFDECSVSKEIDALMLSGKDYGHLLDGIKTKTHLWQALHASEPDESGYGTRGLDTYEIESFVEECPACHTAWLLIRERKKARQELGNARRAIRTIGRAELARAASEEAKAL